MGLRDRLKHSWDAFLGRDPTSMVGSPQSNIIGYGFSTQPDRPRFHRGNERSIVTAVYTRIAMDVASVDLRHVDCDENGMFIAERDSGLDNCLSVEANLDQTGRVFMQSAVMNMFDEGVVALVPTVTSQIPKNPASYDIEQMRVGKIVAWHPESVTIDVYNHHTGKHVIKEFLKRYVAIVKNPFYAVMNEPNSTLQRLIRKLAILDDIDERAGAGKLDLIIQLPYVIKTQSRREQAENRRKDIETQLKDSKYGIAYTDGTERITQLNRSVDNTLNTQVEYLTGLLFSQLGMTQEILNGTASEIVMQNYYARTIEPIVSAFTDEMTRKFLTKTARSKHQSIMFFRDPFELVPVSTLGDIADRFTRNAILSSNEIRALIGYKPVDEEIANELSNKNIRQEGTLPLPMEGEEGMDEYANGEEQYQDSASAEPAVDAGPVQE